MNPYLHNPPYFSKTSDPLAFHFFRVTEMTADEVSDSCLICLDTLSSHDQEENIAVGHFFRGRRVHMMHKMCWELSMDRTMQGPISDWREQACSVCKLIFSVPYEILESRSSMQGSRFDDETLALHNQQLDTASLFSYSRMHGYNFQLNGVDKAEARALVATTILKQREEGEQNWQLRVDLSRKNAASWKELFAILLASKEEAQIFYQFSAEELNQVLRLMLRHRYAASKIYSMCTDYSRWLSQHDPKLQAWINTYAQDLKFIDPHERDFLLKVKELVMLPEYATLICKNTSNWVVEENRIGWSDRFERLWDWRKFRGLILDWINLEQSERQWFLEKGPGVLIWFRACCHYFYHNFKDNSLPTNEREWLFSTQSLVNDDSFISGLVRNWQCISPGAREWLVRHDPSIIAKHFLQLTVKEAGCILELGVEKYYQRLVSLLEKALASEIEN